MIQELDAQLKPGMNVKFSLRPKNYDNDKHPIFYVNKDKHEILQ